VGELASMLPEEGGIIAGRSCIRRFWAFQNGWLTWMYSLVDMAIYPVLFNQYLRYFIPDWMREWNGSSRLPLFGRAWINVPLGERHSCFNYRRLLHHARLSCLSVASGAANPHIPWQPFASEGTRGLAVGRWYLDCALELHRLG